MSSLPFFTALPPAPVTPANSAATPPEAPSTLGSEAGEQNSGALYNQVQTDTEGESSSQSFWQTLQQQSASAPPPLGQSFAALKASVETPASDGIMVEELVIEEIQLEGLKQDQGTEGLESIIPEPLNWQFNEQPVEDTGPTMAHIEAQRAVEPQYLEKIINSDPTAEVKLNALEMQSHVMEQVEQVEGVQIYANGLAQQPLSLAKATQNQVPLNSENQGQDVLSATTPKPLTSTQTKPLVQGQAASQINVLSGSTENDGRAVRGIAFEGTSLEEPLVNIHERPMTLNPQDSGNKPVSLMTTTTSEIAVNSEGEALDNLTQGSQQNNKDQQTASRVLNQGAGNTEKLPPSQAKIDVPPSHPQFTDQVAKRIAILSTEQLQTARIQLDPPELGALEIKIKVQHDQVSVAFASGHQVVRDALEAQAPRLRELMEQQGIDLTDVNVSDQSQQQTASDEQKNELMDGDNSNWNSEDQEEDMLSNEIQSDSLVDYFA